MNLEITRNELRTRLWGIVWLTVRHGYQLESASRPSQGATAQRGWRSDPWRARDVPNFSTSERSSCLWSGTRSLYEGGCSFLG